MPLSIGVAPSLLSLCQQLRLSTVFALALFISSFATVQFADARPGELDTTFGASGRVDFQFPGMNDWHAGEIVVQTDGKVVVAAYCRFANGDEVMCLSRLLQSGAPDASFGAQGMVITLADKLAQSQPTRVVIQEDGKLVNAGTCQIGTTTRICAVRLNNDGSRDVTFGVGGKLVITDRTTRSYTGALAKRSNGKLVVAGNCESSESSQPFVICVARTDINGAMDASFGLNGVALVAVPLSVSTIVVRSVEMQSDGKIVVVATCFASGASAPDACLFRLLSNGASDSSYGTNGIVFARVSPDGFSDPAAGAMLPDDSVVVGGSCGIAARFCLGRVLSTGTVDPKLPFAAAPSAFFHITALRIQDDGKLLAAGRCRPSFDNVSCWLRYSGDGSIDASVVPVIETSPMSSGDSVALQLDGKIVIATNYYSNNLGALRFYLKRYEGGPFGNARCSLDIDGDGTVNAHVDGFLLTRAMLGFVGPAVYAGITFPSNAIRRKWGDNSDSDIRKFLVSQCGVRIN